MLIRDAHAIEGIEAATRALLAAGDGEAAVAPLETFVAAHPAAARGWWLLGLVLHDAQRHEAALDAMERAARLSPGARAAALGVAQLRFETGRPAAAAFADLHARFPDDEGIVRGLANALAAEGQPSEAEAVLAAAIVRDPGPAALLALLATIRQTRGRADYDAVYGEAVARTPSDLPLRLAWFHLLAKARRWDDARAVVAQARATLGERPALVLAELYIASESEESRDPELLVALPPSPDPGAELLAVRHALRTGRPERAAATAERFVAPPHAALFWPYLSLAWRLNGEGREDWLDRPAGTVRTFDLDLAEAEIAELAALLRTLHTTSAPYLDQSVRGGTQTDRPLLFRHEAIVARVRSAIAAAVARYVAALPPPEPGHPLLGASRDRPLRFAGSWSVRLGAQGFHASHTHPAGWISSALYVALPQAPVPESAGWLRLGAPPPELGLAIEPHTLVRPKVGELTLFPSTLWHGTEPFADGERLTVAFDVARPR